MLSLILSLCITGFYIALSILFPKQHFHEAMYVSTLHSLRNFQYICFATGMSGLIGINENTITLSTKEYRHIIYFPSSVTLYSNKHFLGFKSNLNTSFSGSLFFNHPLDSRRLPFPIGATFLRYRPF